MCLAVPAIVVKIEDDIAYVDVGDGIKRPVIIGILEDRIKEGDVVLVHAGIIISKVDSESMKEVFEMYREYLKEILKNENLNDKEIEAKVNEILKRTFKVNI